MSDDSQSELADTAAQKGGPRRLELLGPADDALMLQAVLEAGADTVEFRGPDLPARRPATNFRQEEFRAAVQLAHERGAQVRLALDMEIAEDGIRQAASLLEWARECGVDAVLVGDPALLGLRTEYPQLAFHLQSFAANSADVAAAGELGAARAVLARELTSAQIAAASAVPGVQTEVFAQASLCGCVSSWLLPDWIGEVPRPAGEGTSGALSPPDLAPAYRLDDLRRAGVAALRIESRGNAAPRLGQAVAFYRRVLAGEAVEGSQPTEGNSHSGELQSRGPDRTEPAEATGADLGESQAAYELQILVGGPRIEIRCECHDHVVEWSIPKTVVRRPRKAVSVEALLRHLQAEPIRGHQLVKVATDDPDYLLVPRAANEVMARVSTAIHQALKKRKAPLVRDLPAAVHQLLQPGEPDSANRRTLTDPPDRVRLHADDAVQFLEAVQPDGGVIVEGVTPESLREIHNACRRRPLIVALPRVFFEDQIAEFEDLLQACRRLRAIVEVNSWGAWRLARACGVRLESGPGLSVRNSLAARTLAHLGVQCVTVSLAAGRKQLEQLTENCPVSCALVVFGRPPLLTTRCESPERYRGQLAGSRGAELVPRQEGALWEFRPRRPFDLRGCRNRRIGARHLVVDLIGSPDPFAEWQRVPRLGDRPFRFNYDRHPSDA